MNKKLPDDCFGRNMKLRVHKNTQQSEYLTIILRGRFRYINNSLHLARKYARIFVRAHYLLREANSFPRAKLEENCELRGTDNIQDKYPSIFLKTNWGCCVYYPSVLKIGEYPRIFPNFSWGIFAYVTRLDQSRASENIWWIIRNDIKPTRRVASSWSWSFHIQQAREE